MAITFKRTISPFFQSFFDEKATLNERAYQSELACEFVLRDGTVLPYATTDLSITSLSKDGASVNIAPINFVGRLSGAPDVRHSQSKSPDAGQFTIVNLDYIISSAVPDSSRPFDNATVTVYLCIPKSDGTYEALIFFIGLFREAEGDDEDGRISVIHHLSSKAATLGKEMTQRCVNELGDNWCGVPVGTLPIGAVCSKLWSDKVSGCQYWGGVFNGVPFINPSGLVQGYGGTAGTGWGDGSWTPSCPDADSTWFPSAEGGFIHAREIKSGHTILNHLGEPVSVTDARIVMAEYRYYVETRVGARLIVSASHRFLRSLDDEKGKVAHEWKMENKMVAGNLRTGIIEIEGEEYDKDGFVKRKAGYFLKPVHAGEVLKLSTSAPNTYLAGMEKGAFIGNHNTKPIYTTI